MTSTVTMTVGDVCTTDVVVTYPDAPFREAVMLVESHGVHALPVLDAAQQLVGIVTQSDLLLKEELLPEPGSEHTFLRLRRRRDHARAAARTVGELMSSPVHTISPGATLAAAARKLHSCGVGRLVVVGDDGRMAGIVTRSDLLRPYLKSDIELTGDVAHALRECGVGADEVEVQVRDGIVHLRGEVDLSSRVGLLLQRVRCVPGIVGVEERITCRSDDLHFAAFGL